MTTPARTLDRGCALPFWVVLVLWLVFFVLLSLERRREPAPVPVVPMPDPAAVVPVRVT